MRAIAASSSIVRIVTSRPAIVIGHAASNTSFAASGSCQMFASATDEMSPPYAATRP